MDDKGRENLQKPLTSPSPSPLPAPESSELTVMSEVHIGCPPNFAGPYISYFTFSIPFVVMLTGGRCDTDVIEETNSTEHIVETDEDGDLIVVRRTRQSYHSGAVTIQHNITSTIPGVGLQVWRAELILADYVLHKMFLSSEFDGVVAVELGAGLVGILLARAAETVFITDHGEEVLDNCTRNVLSNSEMFTSQSSVKVRELDWFKPWPPSDLASRGRYSCTCSEVEEIERASVLFAADVIYSDDITDALFCILEKLMCQGSDKVLYMAMEKRYNFTLDDLDVVANGYMHFRSYMRDEESDIVASKSYRDFVGKRIDLEDIPQYMREYERGNDVELWEIKYVRNIEGAKSAS